MWASSDSSASPAGTISSVRARSLRADVRVGSSVYRFQFHPEVDEPLIERWLHVPAHRQNLEGVAEKAGPEEIRRETPERIAGLEDSWDKRPS
jgi:GMP synthase-like glutamine amidotransferase